MESHECSTDDDFADALAGVFTSAIQVVGRPDQGRGTPAPWWTQECQTAYREHLQARNLPPNVIVPLATREFQGTVRRAKREYWKQIINGVSDDKALYRVVGWHKLAPNLKAPPLVVNRVTIEDTIAKAEAL